MGDEIWTDREEMGLAHICLGRNILRSGLTVEECMAELEVRGQLGWTTQCLGTAVIKGAYNGYIEV